MAGLVSATRLFLAHYGLLALFVLLVLEEAGLWLPLPGDLLIAYFGAQLAFASNPLLAALPMLLVITAGVLVGSLLLYVLVRRFRWVIHRFGRFIQLDEARLAGLEVWFTRYGVAIIIPGRLIPGLRIPTTVVSSTFGVPLPFFSLAVSVAAIIWGSAFLALGLAGLGIVRVGKALIPDAPLEWVAWVLAITALVVLTLAIRRHFIRAHSQ